MNSATLPPSSPPLSAEPDLMFKPSGIATAFAAVPCLPVLPAQLRCR